jgi:hypothetical protein
MSGILFHFFFSLTWVLVTRRYAPAMRMIGTISSPRRMVVLVSQRPVSVLRLSVQSHCSGHGANEQVSPTLPTLDPFGQI